eukprot:g45479.t1
MTTKPDSNSPSSSGWWGWWASWASWAARAAAAPLAAHLAPADAQHELAQHYQDFRGVHQNLARAAKWYRRPAEQGHAKAQYSLGVCYANGEGVRQDLARAAEWYRRAAEQGLAVAQLQLGYCYALGEGVAENKTVAVQWHLAPTTFCFYQEKQARFSQGGSPCRWIDMGELIDSGVGGKVDPWTNEDGPDFPLDASGPRQAFPRGSVDLSFQQVFMVDQDGPSSSARNTQLVVMLEPAKDVGGASLKRAKICSVAKLRDLHSTMQGGDAPVNASNGVAQAQAKRDQLTSGLTPTYADIAAGRPALPGNQTKQRRNLPGKQSQTEMFTGIPQGLPNYGNNCHVNGLVQAINAAMPVLPVLDDPLFKTCALLRKRNSQIKTTHKDLLQVLREVGLDTQMQQDPHEAYIKLVDRLSVGHHLGELEVKTNFTCDRCQSASSSLEKLSPAVLSLAIPHNGETTLASCLSLHCQDERVERKCDNCSNKTASKKIEVRADPRKLPGVFVLHIKRFRGQGLTADRGHFTALVRNMEGKWFHVDDSKVEPWSPKPPRIATCRAHR